MPGLHRRAMHKTLLCGVQLADSSVMADQDMDCRGFGPGCCRRHGHRSAHGHHRPAADGGRLPQPRWPGCGVSSSCQVLAAFLGIITACYDQPG